MDIKPTSDQSSSEDQELAKVLAGVNEQIEKDNSNEPTGLHFEETPSSNTPGAPLPPSSLPDPTASLPPVAPPAPDPVAAEPVAAPAADDSAPTDPALESIKKDALSELRPLVDKLNVSADEKFDTYLLLLRSTDDKSLIGPAHEAAKGITDEARRAQALLDIIKEIDYLSHSKTA